MSEVVGIYPVPEAGEPCYLVEIKVRREDFDFGEITQLDAEDAFVRLAGPGRAGVLYEGDDEATLVFFFHSLDPSTPLRTPWGELPLPEPSPRPERLADIEYEEP